MELAYSLDPRSHQIHLTKAETAWPLPSGELGRVLDTARSEWKLHGRGPEKGYARMVYNGQAWDIPNAFNGNGYTGELPEGKEQFQLYWENGVPKTGLLYTGGSERSLTVTQYEPDSASCPLRGGVHYVYRGDERCAAPRNVFIFTPQSLTARIYKPGSAEPVFTAIFSAGGMNLRSPRRQATY